MSPRKVSLRKILDAIHSMKQSQAEDKFLSKLDMMFGVLISLTIFMSGIIISNSLNQTYVNRPLLFFGTSTLVIFIVALIGEFYAILCDNLTLRFDFWAVLINGLVQVIGKVVVTYFMALLLLERGEIFYYSAYGYLTTFIIELPRFILILVFVPFILMKLYKRFIAKFQIRRGEIKKRSFIFFEKLSWTMTLLIYVPDIFLIRMLQ